MVRIQSTEVLGTFTIIRVFRIARIARVSRFVVRFRTLWFITQGLIGSIVPIFWTALIVCVLIYIFSVIGLTLIKPDDSKNADYNITVDVYFKDLFTTMVTLLQGVTLDSFNVVYRPIVFAKPYLIVFFGMFIFTLAIALMNMVTAIIVQASFDQASKDKEAEMLWRQKQREIAARSLCDLFLDLDSDNSNKITYDELVHAPEEVQSKILNICSVYSLQEIFAMLDFDGNGEVDITEFCDGILQIEHGAPKGLFNIEKLCRRVLQLLLSQQRQVPSHYESQPIELFDV